MTGPSTPTGTSRHIGTAAPAWTITRLLHVEDNEADALLFQEYIRGVVPAVEFNTVARMEDLTDDTVASDCAILDLSLPGARGLEALHTLRGLSEDLPIIVLTGMDDLDLAVEALRHGADDYLVKNEVGGALLRRTIRYAIERRRLRRELLAEAIATTVATARTVTAEDALRVAEAGTVVAETALGVAHAETKTAVEALQLLAVSYGEREAAPAGGLAGPHSDFRTSTHEVAVGVDDISGEYDLRCTDCEWVAARGSQVHHSRRARRLDVALFDHVDFGGLLGPYAAMPPGPGTVASVAAGDAVFGPVFAARALHEPRAARALPKPSAVQVVDPDGLEPPTSAL